MTTGTQRGDKSEIQRLDSDLPEMYEGIPLLLRDTARENRLVIVTSSTAAEVEQILDRASVCAVYGVRLELQGCGCYMWPASMTFFPRYLPRKQKTAGAYVTRRAYSTIVYR